MAIVKIAKKKKAEIEMKKKKPRWRRSNVARRSSPLEEEEKQQSPTSTPPPSLPYYKYVAGDPSTPPSSRLSRFSATMKTSSSPRSPPPPGFPLPIYRPISSSDYLYYDYSSPSPSFFPSSSSSQRSVNSRFYYDRPIVPVPFSLSTELDCRPATPTHAPICIKEFSCC